MNRIRTAMVVLSICGALMCFARSFVPPVSNVQASHRPPAVPLITHDPYWSIWSAADTLTSEPTKHWTGSDQPISSLIRIDGLTYRLMGREPNSVNAMPQTSLEVHPTRTIYSFVGHGVRVLLTFTTPLLPNDLKVYSNPTSYITWTVEPTDGGHHQVQVMLAASGLLAVNKADQQVAWRAAEGENWRGIRVGNIDQPILQKHGDDLRIDWGHLYLVASDEASTQAGNFQDISSTFEQSGGLGGLKAGRNGAGEASVALALEIPKGEKSVHAMLSYDDQYSIQYFGQNLRPYWHKYYSSISGALSQAAKSFESVSKKCEKFDRELESDLASEGGSDYAYLASLAYRQSLAAQKLALDPSGSPLLFPKENFSNGCISTVDVIYPAAPLLLFTSPTLTRASLVPVLQYSASSRWKFPFAPHDLGTYPKANGQVYGGGERTEDDQMPVEESGNMIILLAALAKVEGSASLAKAYWPQVSKWAAYLAEKGFDPENQLCTDDFAGHLAHNVNLSAKAIVALGAYAQLCDQLGHSGEAAKYHDLAKGFAGRWEKEGLDGDHYRLAFDKPGSWSQKYNLVWDRLLGLNLFSPAVAETEMAFYKSKVNEYGLPLDNRKDYTKLDWITWTATLTSNKNDFETLVDPIVKFLDTTTDRVPMTDWYETKEPRKVGFQARSVVGGVYIKMLENQKRWKDWAGKDKEHFTRWAPLPSPTTYQPVVSTAVEAKVTWRYTVNQPDQNWMKPQFDDASWQSGIGGFGTDGTPSAVIGTKWDGDDIWIRRQFDVADPRHLLLKIHHDEDAEVYVNGKLIAQLPGYLTNYEVVPLPVSALKAFKKGVNTLAIHCHQTQGGQYIDAGFVRQVPKD